MDVYKIVLVDDEDELRGRIASNISPSSGFEVVGSAGNGYDALDLIEKYSPQVVLTDIKMPYIDGIELARIIRRDYPTVHIGFITGYEEFDYAREAIKLGIETYLTKPLTQQDIENFLAKLKADLDREYAEDYNREQIELRYQKSVPLIIENCFISFLASGSAGSREDIEQLRAYGVSLDESSYLVALVMAERNPENWGIIEFEKLKLSMRSRLASSLSLEGFESYSFMFHEGLVFVIKEKGGDFLQEIDIVFNRMVNATESFLSVKIDIGVSTLRRNFAQFVQAYEEAQSALARSRFGAESRISYFSQVEEHRPSPTGFKEGDLRGLEQTLRYGSETDLLAALNTIRTEASAREGGGEAIGLYSLSLMAILANYASSIGLDLYELAGEDVIALIAKIRSWEQLCSWFIVLNRKIREGGIAARFDNAKRLLEQAVAYIYQHYSDPTLTMDSVCGSLDISASYLSQLFKKHKGSSFVKFLTGVRMTKAKELLLTTGDRIAEIALACGYQDIYYFSHSFKKYTGVPPKKFREENA